MKRIGRFAVILLVILCWTTVANSCPTNQTLHVYCNCDSDSSYSGVMLDCSSRPAELTVALLRENRAQLGLIQELKLQNASLNHLPAKFLRGLYVKKLDVSNNNISVIAEDAFDGLESILQAFIANHNRLTALPNTPLNGLTSLLQIDLSNNSIGDLDSRHAFKNVPKLYDINLAGNEICDVQKSVFEAVKHSVQTLNLGHNCLKSVPASALRGFRQMLALHLHKNRIASLDPLNFMNLPLLNLINLAANEISKIHRQAFLNVPNVRLLYLSNNKLHSLKANQFRHFTTLELLDLTENQLTTLPTLAFANMPQLSYLYLGDNKIYTIEKNTFVNSSLVILLLPNNQMTRLDQDMLKGLNKLQQFNLKNNKIADIAQNTFYEMPSLIMLDLSKNRLSSLQPATFLAQLNMFLIDLSSNRLTTTPYHAFNKRITTVVLQENPLVCNERVHMLQQGQGVYIPSTVDKVCGDKGAATVTTTLSPSVDKFAFIQASTTTRRPIIRPLTPKSRPRIPPLVSLVLTSTPRPQTTASGPPRLRLEASRRPVISGRRPVFSRDGWTPIPSSGGRFSGTTTTAAITTTALPPPIHPEWKGPPINGGYPRPTVPRNNEQTTTATTRARQATPFIGFRRPSTSARRRRPVVGPNGLTVPPLIPDPNWTEPTKTKTATTTEKPNVRYPFPVPFLSKAPVFRAFPHTTPVPPPTLPPGIILATARPPPAKLPEWTSPRPRVTVPWVSNNFLTRAPNRPWQESAIQRNRTPAGRRAPTSPVQPNNGRREPVEVFHSTQSVAKSSIVAATTTAVPFRPSTTTTPATAATTIRQSVLFGRTSPKAVFRTGLTSEEEERLDVTPPKKKHELIDQYDKYNPDGLVADGGGDAAAAVGAGTGGATTTIAVCLSVVILVLVGVFVTLCVVRHRTSRSAGGGGTKRSSSSSTSSAVARTSAYVAAQAAQLNYATYGVAGGTLSHNSRAQLSPVRSASVASNRQPPAAWIYTPGTYTSASNSYYK